MQPYGAVARLEERGVVTSHNTTLNGSATAGEEEVEPRRYTASHLSTAGREVAKRVIV